MKRAFEFSDDKSHKFWWIESKDSAYVVNYGRTGTIGKYQIKEFDDAAECTKEAEKLIASKLRKGYKEIDNYDFDHHIYLDDEEIGPHPLTSHPNFRRSFTDEEFYYSVLDDESPFGSDEGSDTLAFIGEEIRKKGTLDFLDFPRHLIEDDFDMPYLCPPEGEIDAAAAQELAKKQSSELAQSDMVTYATAFGQIKVTGRIDRKLKERALQAIRRFSVAFLTDPNEAVSPLAMQLLSDLERFDIYA